MCCALSGMNAGEAARRPTATQFPIGALVHHRSPSSIMASVDVGDANGSSLLHDDFKLARQKVQNGLDALLPERSQAPETGPADGDGIGVRRQRLEYVRTPAKPAVHDHRNPPPDRIHDFGKALDRAVPAVLGSATVVRDDDPIHPVFHRENGTAARLRTPDDGLGAFPVRIRVELDP